MVGTIFHVYQQTQIYLYFLCNKAKVDKPVFSKQCFRILFVNDLDTQQIQSTISFNLAKVRNFRFPKILEAI